MLKVRDYRGMEIIIHRTLFDHVKLRHPDLLRKLKLADAQDLIRAVANVLQNPHEVYVDDKKAHYYIQGLNDIFMAVIVYEGVARTTYLLGNKSYFRMRSRRWLYRIY